MNANHEKVCVIIALGALVTSGYVSYVTLTHGDGTAFAAFVGALCVLGGYFYGKRHQS